MSAAARSFDGGNVNVLHAHHRIKRPLCFFATDRQRFGQHPRCDLPGDAPLVLAPAALALLATIADNGVPVAVGMLLIVGGDLEREGFAMFQSGSAIEADARNAGNCEFDYQRVALLAGWEVMDGMFPR
jgi:hypothetical protein